MAVPANPYIPRKDADLVAWATNFNTLITADPFRYGLLAPDAATIDTYVSQYVAAYTLAVDPSTRTRASVADKDAQRAAMLGIVRIYALQIKQNTGVSNDDKTALGLHINDTTRSPVAAPQTQPLLSIVAATPGVHTLRFADANTPDRRSKPFGALHLQLNVAVAAAPVTDPAASMLYGLFNKQPLATTFAAADAGKVATYFGRWVGRRGDVGPWSLPVSMIVAF